jgi:predicted HicB family RNase H-like nuclease
MITRIGETMKKEVKKPSVLQPVRYPGELHEKLCKRAKKAGSNFSQTVISLLNKVIDRK